MTLEEMLDYHIAQVVKEGSEMVEKYGTYTTQWFNFNQMIQAREAIRQTELLEKIVQRIDDVESSVNNLNPLYK